MTNALLWLSLLLAVAAWFCAATDAYDNYYKFGLVLLLCPAIYWTYALAYPRRPRALASLGLTILAVTALFIGLEIRP